MIKKIKYAGFWQRLLAHNIDLLPILLLFYVSSLFLPRTFLDYIFYFVIYLGYHVTFEASTMQATPGKRWAKIKVVDRACQPPGTKRSLVRNCAKILSVLLLFTGFGMIAMNREKKALHDYIGGTLVLFEED